MKKDEVIRPGETLTFDTYLIDIGDPEGDHKTLSDFNSRGENEKIIEKSNLSHGRTFRKNSIFTGNTLIYIYWAINVIIPSFALLQDSRFDYS